MKPPADVRHHCLVILVFLPNLAVHLQKVKECNHTHMVHKERGCELNLHGAPRMVQNRPRHETRYYVGQKNGVVA